MSRTGRRQASMLRIRKAQETERRKKGRGKKDEGTNGKSPCRRKGRGRKTRELDIERQGGCVGVGKCRRMSSEKRLGAGPLLEVPGDREDTGVQVTVVELAEQGRAHVEGTGSATRAKIDNLGARDGASLGVGDLDVLATVCTVRVLRGVHSDDHFGVAVGPATSAESDGVVGGGTGAATLGGSGLSNAGKGEDSGDREEGLDGNHFECCVCLGFVGKDVPVVVV
jgi:hypothetical protein